MRVQLEALPLASFSARMLSLSRPERRYEQNSFPHLERPGPKRRGGSRCQLSIRPAVWRDGEATQQRSEHLRAGRAEGRVLGCLSWASQGRVLPAQLEDVASDFSSHYGAICTGPSLCSTWDSAALPLAHLACPVSCTHAGTTVVFEARRRGGHTTLRRLCVGLLPHS